MHKILFICFYSLFLPVCLHAQNFEIDGSVKDSETQEPLIAATILVKEDPTKGAFTDENGEFKLSLPQGSYTLIATYFGYKNDTIPVTLNNDLSLNIPLSTEAKKMDEVVLKGTSNKENVESTEMGKIELSTEQAEKIPAMLGETDLLKTLQLMPGVQAGGEGNTGLYVRGGGPDQNLFLIDDAPVYNTGHLFGFLSVFNSDAISGVDLYKGNMPANYGGRLSSVVDFRMREGDFQKYNVEGGIGLISSRLTVDGPIVKDKASFMISGRRSYIDILTKPFVRQGSNRGVPYYFYDLNGKLSWKAGDKDHITFSSYYGRDNLNLDFFNGRVKASTFWGNHTATLKWNHVYNEKLVQTSYLIYNKFDFTSTASFDDYESEVNSAIEDYSAKVSFDYFPHKNHQVKFGVDYTWHNYRPRRTEASSDSTTFGENSINTDKYAHDIAVYLLDEFDIGEKFRLNVGLRYNIFMQVGPYKYLEDNEFGVDTTQYSGGEIVKTWDGLEPRVGLRYLINKNSSLKTAFNINNQYIHLATLTGASMPFDIWLPSSIRIPPQRGWQYSLGYFRNLADNNYEISVEGYYKEMDNQLEYRQDYVPKVSGEVEEDLVIGDGWSYGVELFAKKKFGDFQGWIGYTWSRTFRKFDQINEGRIFPARYDRIHDVNVVAIYDLGERWSFGATFVFASGQAITLPERRYFVEGVMYYQYGDRNSYRMEPYHRMDISATYKNKETKKFKSSFTLAIYNVYNRKNPYFYYVSADGNPTGGDFALQAKKIYLFPIMPSLTWNFSF